MVKREGYNRTTNLENTVEPIGNQHLSLIVRCPLLRGFRYISGRRGMCNRAVEHDVAAFSELFLCCTLAGKAKQRLVLQVTGLM